MSKAIEPTSKKPIAASGCDPTATSAWKALQKHAEALADVHIKDLFAKDPQRFDRYSLDFDGMLFDYSKNLVTEETLLLLRGLAREMDLDEWIERLFSGELVNNTEQRPALHTALRNRSDTPVFAEGQDVMPQVREQLARMRAFVERLHRGDYRGYTGRVITDVVNIGVGGSDLGAVMATEALAPYKSNAIRLHFVSSIDGVHVTDVLERVNPKTTLFIVSSKSFTTLDTMTNAATARQWFLRQMDDPAAIAVHFLGVSANPGAMTKWGICPTNQFLIWDWVGGRYSLPSATGLPIAIAIGMDHFDAMLEGMHAMDQHFRGAPFDENLPATLALLGIWNSNFLGAEGHVVLPYDHRLHRFPAYLQQLEMESNGKSVTRDGAPVSYQTGSVVWGEVGSNAQHSFYQLLHQGTRRITADFLVPVLGSSEFPGHHDLALANCFAQAQALMTGQDADQARAEMERGGLDPDAIERALPHKIHPGNRSTNMILFDRLNPYSLGQLIALYEHKVFVQSVIWNINPFDQWGVELGKKLAKALLPAVSDPGKLPDSTDSSTRGLLTRVDQIRNSGR